MLWACWVLKCRKECNMRVIIISLLLVCCLACSDKKKEKENMDRVENYRPVKPKELNENAIKLIGDRWMLVTAGDTSKFNTMTASWGCMGYLWNKPVVFIFVRPQRYTFEFLEDKDEFTLSFFEEKYRPALSLCGSVSGRDVNKVKESGLTPCVTESGNIAFREANLILECKKLYADFMKPEAFIDTTIIADKYAEGDFHKIYVAEIVNAWARK